MQNVSAQYPRGANLVKNRLWIMSSKAEFTRHSLSRLGEEAAQLDIDLSIYRPDELTWEFRDSGQLCVFDTELRSLPLPQVLFTKMGSSTMNHRCRDLMLACESTGRIKVVNSTQTYRMLGDKWSTFQNAKVADLPVAHSLFVDTVESFDQAVTSLGLPFVLKDPFGARGEAVNLIETRLQVEEFRERVLRGDRKFIAQEYLSDSHGRDIRILVVGSRIVGAIE